MLITLVCVGLLAFVLVILLGLCITRLNALHLRLHTCTKDLELYQQENLTLKEKLQSLATDLSQSQTLLQKSREQNARLEANLETTQKLNANLEEKYQHNLSTLKSELEKNFHHQQESLLKQNEITLHKDSKKILDEIFTPIKASMELYAKSLGENEAKMQANITNMFQSSKLMSENAEKLTQILKGDKKIRGNFGELQLKNVLESSGLIQGQQYDLQAHFKDEEQSYRPDAVVYLNDNKSIIIDAKFSLPSDFGFENIDSHTCTQLAQNLKARIDELAKKPYARFDAHTYNFVLLFIPYQNILDLALESDNSLYQYAYNKKIYITTPHTLLMALKTIDISWQHIDMDKKALKTFEMAGKLYDQFATVMQNFQTINNKAQSLQKSIDTLGTSLSGRVGLERQIERLKELGAKTTKSLPSYDS